MLKQPILWLLPAAYAISAGKFNEVSIGYVMNDDAISYLDDFKRIWKSLSHLSAKGFPPLTFPLYRQCASDIKFGLPDEIRDLCVYCEIPKPKSDGDGFEPCGYCDKCKKVGPDGSPNDVKVEVIPDELSFDI